MNSERSKASLGDAARVAPVDLLAIYDLLFSAYGPQKWWPAENAIEMIVGAILVQNTAWTNATRAIARLKAADALSFAALDALSEADLAELIRPSGCYRAKARKLKAFATHVIERHGGSLATLFDQTAPNLRRELLAIHGIGPETADSIILYGAQKPTFVADSYARRLFARLGAQERPTYTSVQAVCRQSLPADTELFNEFHALIVYHAKAHCRAKPRCIGCPLRDVCRHPGMIDTPFSDSYHDL